MPRHSLCFIAAYTFALQIASTSLAEEPWRFINLPDWHDAEKYVQVWPDGWKKWSPSYEAFRDASIARDAAKLRAVYDAHGGELLVIPGDTNRGHWDTKAFRKQFRSVPKYKDLTKAEVVTTASHLCYGNLAEAFKQGGYPNQLVAVGDHEVGDNPWPPGSDLSQLIPLFRSGFADIFTRTSPGGASRFNAPIGKAPARPIGTTYEDTSFAVQHKNVLFVTVDVFRQDGPDIVLGAEGTIIGDITGEHLKWFTAVLEAAQDISSIDHIVVQAHLPIFSPVRKYASSGMLMEHTDECSLLKVMRQYKVDLYLAGEVHHNTVTTDPQSNLVQFVGRGNGASNFGVVDVEENRLTVRNYHSDGRLLGTLAIDKSGEKTVITGDGVMKPIDPDGLQIHWSFDRALSQEGFKTSVDGERALNGKPCKTVHENTGELANEYAIYGANTTQVADGRVGEAVKFTPDSFMTMTAMGPLMLNFERTVACWIRTEATGRQLILNTASRWRNHGQFFNLGLNDGRLELALKPNKTSLVEQPALNDGRWHHVAVVVPNDEARQSDVQFFVDGKRMTNVRSEGDNPKINTPQSHWMALAANANNNKTKVLKDMKMTGYTGELDDFAIWTRALTGAEIAALVRGALKDGHNAAQVEAGFRRP